MSAPLKLDTDATCVPPPPTYATLADRLYAERFDRMPSEEPWRSQWLRIEGWHAAALEAGEHDHHALSLACQLADERYRIECLWRAECSRRMAEEARSA